MNIQDNRDINTDGAAISESSPLRLPGNPRVALVHDWLTGMRGGEKVLQVFCDLFPGADLYTLLHVKGSTSPAIEKRRIVVSPLGRMPGISRYYRWTLPLMPRAIESIRLSNYDLVFSSSHCVAKGIIPPGNALSLCYCHTPMRYVWERFDDYFGNKPPLLKSLISWQARRLRAWDRRVSHRVSHWIANSTEVQRRILQHYCVNRDKVSVIHPPVDTERFRHAWKCPPPDGLQSGSYFLVVSALVAYKRIDLAVQAAMRAGKKLVIIGGGPEEKRLRKLVVGKIGHECQAAETIRNKAEVIFAGSVSDELIPRYYAHCRAFLFPGLEDFGITPLEATAAGRPVVAYRAGGALDTVIEGLNGIFFEKQTVDSLALALDDPRLYGPWNRQAMSEHADKFDLPRFREDIGLFIRGKWIQHRGGQSE